MGRPNVAWSSTIENIDDEILIRENGEIDEAEEAKSEWMDWVAWQLPQYDESIVEELYDDLNDEEMELIETGTDEEVKAFFITELDKWN